MQLTSSTGNVKATIFNTQCSLILYLRELVASLIFPLPRKLKCLLEIYFNLWALNKYRNTATTATYLSTELSDLLFRRDLYALKLLITVLLPHYCILILNYRGLCNSDPIFRICLIKVWRKELKEIKSDMSIAHLNLFYKISS